jgi:hypothetical protein
LSEGQTTSAIHNLLPGIATGIQHNVNEGDDGGEKLGHFGGINGAKDAVTIRTWSKEEEGQREPAEFKMLRFRKAWRFWLWWRDRIVP